MNGKIVVALGFTILLGGCSGFSKKMIEKPKVGIKKVKFQDIGPSGAKLIFVLNVFNPNAFDLKIDMLKYDIEVEGKKLTAGQLEHPASVAAKTEATVDLPIPIQYDRLFSSALDFALKGKSSYRIKGEARFGFVTIPFDDSGELSLRNY